MLSRFCGSSVESKKAVRRLAAHKTNCKALSVVLGDPINLRSPRADTATRVLENTTSSLQFGTRQSSGIDFSLLVLNHVWMRQEIRSIGPVLNDVFKRSVFHLPYQHAQPFTAVHTPLSCRGRGFRTGPIIIKPPREVISFPIYDPHGIPSKEEIGEIRWLYEPFVKLYMKSSNNTSPKKEITWGALAEAILRTPLEMRHSLLKQIPKRNLTIIDDNSLSDVCLVFRKPDFRLQMRRGITAIGIVHSLKRWVLQLPDHHALPFKPLPRVVHGPLGAVCFVSQPGIRVRAFGTGLPIIRPPQEVISFPRYDAHSIPSEEEIGEIRRLYEPFVELYMKSSNKAKPKKNINWGALAGAIMQTSPERRRSLLEQILGRNLNIINDNSLSDLCLVFQKPDFSKYDLTVNSNATPQDVSRMNHVHSVIVRNAKGDLDFWDNNVIENVYTHQATSEMQAITLAGQILRERKDLKNLKIVVQSASESAVKIAKSGSINRKKGEAFVKACSDLHNEISNLRKEGCKVVVKHISAEENFVADAAGRAYFRRRNREKINAIVKEKVEDNRHPLLIFKKRKLTQDRTTSARVVPKF